MLSFSTSWNMHRHREGESIVEELLGMGISTIELGHGLKVSQVQGIVRMVEQGAVRVSSVHNFCPHPIEVQGNSPDCYEFTSHRESDRSRALRLTRKTIELAGRLGAQAVVLHGGRVRTMKNYRKALEMIEAGEFLTKAYGDMKIEAVQAREAAGPRRLERLRNALQDLLPLAQTEGVHLGLENRERYEDVPSEREMLTFLSRIDHSHLGYWHDFGHAQIKENLAFLDHRRWFAEAAPRLVGCHVHDVIWPNEDHQPPFTGEIRFADLLPQIPHGIPIVFEMSPHAEREAILSAWQQFQEYFPE